MVVFPVTTGFRISAARPLDKRLLSVCPYPDCEVTVLCGHTHCVANIDNGPGAGYLTTLINKEI
jgi:hypothetical protein